MATTTAQPTHRIRPKAGNAKWEHVTDEQLASIKSQTGPHSFRSGYEVEPLAQKPEKLPTTTEPTKDKADEKEKK